MLQSLPPRDCLGIRGGGGGDGEAFFGRGLHEIPSPELNMGRNHSMVELLAVARFNKGGQSGCISSLKL